MCLCGGFEPGPGVGDLAELLGGDDPNDLVFTDILLLLMILLI
ncbi:hypothetical protein [Candidatus Ichthyocystis sparus]|nr:hypothetical protein [Candidatus Ichthyocystis sparus]